MDRVVDLIVIGGGINGCGVARDAAGRGLSVVLCEMGDLASSTSSWSTKLIHGGLRYLEHYEFRLVREALTEREVLWAVAPHIIRPMRFVLPHRPGLRSAWVLRLGLFLYDHIGGRKRLRGTRTLSLDSDPLGRPLKPGEFAKGFEYSDCRVDDSRLVVLNARDAADRGAEVRTPRSGGERRSARPTIGRSGCAISGPAESTRLRSRALINAAGPWVEEVLSGRLLLKPKARVRLVQGSHIVVRKLYDHDRAYILQNPDGRIVFTIPFEGAFTLIGTTDLDYDGDPGKATASDEEVAYLCNAVSGNLARPVTVDDVVWSYSGVRPLYDDGASEAKGRDSGLRARGRRRRGGACRLHLRGQDHDLSTSRRGSASPHSSRSCRSSPTTRAGPRRRRCRAAISRSTDCGISRRLSASPIPSLRAATPHGSRAPTARGRAVCWAPLVNGRISEYASEIR